MITEVINTPIKDLLDCIIYFNSLDKVRYILMLAYNVVNFSVLYIVIDNILLHYRQII